MNLRKLVPFIVIAAAIIGIYVNLRVLGLNKKKCNCGDHATPIQ